MGNSAASWRRVHAAARPVLDDPAQTTAVDRLAAHLDARIQHVECEPGVPARLAPTEARARLLSRIAARYLRAATTRADARSDTTWLLLLLAAAYKLRTRYAT